MTDYNTTGPWPQICKRPPSLLRSQTDRDVAASLAVVLCLMSGQASAYTLLFFHVHNRSKSRCNYFQTGGYIHMIHETLIQRATHQK